MRKLKLFKERRGDSHQPVKTADIRGLEDPELFKRSGFEATLYVSGLSAAGITPALLGKYGVESSPVDGHPNCYKWQSNWRQLGEHKLQALRLFVAALELSEQRPECHLLLTFESGLHREVGKRLNGRAANPDTENLKEWLKQPKGVHLAHGIALALRQAGLSIAGEGTLVSLSALDLQQLRANLKGDANAQTNSTKARKQA